MLKILAEKIVDVITEEGYEASVHEQYSGRGMFGEATTGVSTKANIAEVLTSILRAVPDIAGHQEEWEEEGFHIEDIDEIRVDNLSRGYIYY